MDNQYSYYTPEQDDLNYQMQNRGRRDGKKKIPSAVKAAGLGLIFGIAASAAFQTSNVIADKLTGTAAETEKRVEAAGSTQLTTGSGNSVTSDISVIAKNAMPSVVSITNMSVTQVQNFFGGIHEQESESAGSGIIIAQNDTELLILTNNHVVEGNDTLTVSFIDEESAKADIKGTDSERDLALMEILYCTVARVSEIVSLNREDIDFSGRNVLIYSHKSKKERIGYLTESASYHLRQYLEARTDDNPALFVTLRAQFARLGKSGIEAMLREVGKRTGIHAYPHRYRGSFITDACVRGFGLDEVQDYVGHSDPKTTNIYRNKRETVVRAKFDRLIA